MSAIESAVDILADEVPAVPDVEVDVVEGRKKRAYDAFDTSEFEADGDPPKRRLIDGKVYRFLFSDSIKSYLPFHGGELQKVAYDVYFHDNGEDMRLLDRSGIPVVIDKWHSDIAEDEVLAWLEENELGMAWGYDDAQGNKEKAAREWGE